MNKNEIKQIILEEIEAAIMEMASPEQLAADSRPEEDDFSLEDEMEMARDFNDEQDAIFGKPNFVEEEGLEEMARTSNVFKLSQEASMKDVLQFMQRVNDVLKTYKSPGQKRPKKRFTPEEMKALATAMLKPEGFTSKDVIAATTYNSPAQANKFLKALEMKGLITLTSQLKKSMEPTRDPNAPETRGRKAKSAEFDVPDDALDMDFGDFDDLDLSDPLAENEDKLKALIAKGVAQNDEELEESLDGGGPAGGSYKGGTPVHKAFDTVTNIADTLQTGVADLLNISPDMASNVILAAIPASVIVGLAAGAAKGRDRELIPDVVEKFILKFANKFRKAGKEIEFGQGGTYNTFKKYDGVSHFKKFNTNENTMSELEKYIKQQIKEAKNPLAKKMKEIENQGRRAALETKLAAIEEMIEETQGRLTRIDEDNEFRDMMDKNAVKEVRKQLKELERAKAKLQKEYGKMKKMALPKDYDGEKGKVMDEEAPVAEDTIDEDAIENAIDEVELEEDDFKLNESVKRMQKLANLKG